MSRKKRAVVIFPGRGSYNKSELGVIQSHYKDHPFLNDYDQYKVQNNNPTITELDGANVFQRNIHYHGPNSAALIHCCSYLDYLNINQENYEIVAITGNSMGWYLACHAAGALEDQHAFEFIETMASITNNPIGGQLIYPITNQDWIVDYEIKQLVNEKIDDSKIFLSIDYGGFYILAGKKESLNILMKKLPARDIYPQILPGNSAFHTPLLQDAAHKAQEIISCQVFKAPQIPLIDGRGKIWSPHSTTIEEFYHYTTFNQVISTYYFSLAIQKCYREFAPDVFILTGPGSYTAGAVARSLIELNDGPWKDKKSFLAQQKEKPIVLSMAIHEQRSLIV